MICRITQACLSLSTWHPTSPHNHILTVTHSYTHTVLTPHTNVCHQCPELVQVGEPFSCQPQLANDLIELLGSLKRILQAGGRGVCGGWGRWRERCVVGEAGGGRCVWWARQVEEKVWWVGQVKGEECVVGEAGGGRERYHVVSGAGKGREHYVN